MPSALNPDIAPGSTPLNVGMYDPESPGPSAAGALTNAGAEAEDGIMCGGETSVAAPVPAGSMPPEKSARPQTWPRWKTVEDAPRDLSPLLKRHRAGLMRQQALLRLRLVLWLSLLLPLLLRSLLLLLRLLRQPSTPRGRPAFPRPPAGCEEAFGGKVFRGHLRTS